MANRRERFKKLYPKRLKNAVWNIRSIGKLSERTNYIYKEEEVDKILSTLMSELKSSMVKFGSGSVEDRFKRLMDIDLQQLKVLKVNDPELYNFIMSKQSKGTSAIENYLDEREKEEDLFSLSKTSNDKTIAELEKMQTDLDKIQTDSTFHLIEKMGQQIDTLQDENKKQKKELEGKPKRQQVDTKYLEEQIKHLHYLLDRNNDLVLREIEQIKGNMGLSGRLA